MITESQMEKIMPVLDEWMLTTLKIQQLQKKNPSADVTHLMDIEYKLQTELTELWMGCNQKILSQILGNQ
jgi:hypothetical protein